MTLVPYPFFCWNATLPFISLPFFQKWCKTERVKEIEKKVTWQHRKWQTEHYGMQIFFFLEKRKNSGQASGLHHLVASTAAPASIHCSHPSSLSLTHTHTHSQYLSHIHILKRAISPLHEDVVEAFWLDSGPLLTTVYEAEELQTHKFQPNVKCKREGNFFFFFFLPFLLSFMERTECTEGNRQAGREWLKP